MKTVSLILTIALILPMLGTLSSTYQMYIFQNRGQFGHVVNNEFILRLLSPIITNLIFLCIAFFLNIKRKYLENCIMCGTLLLSFVMYLVMSFGINVISQWLR